MKKQIATATALFLLVVGFQACSKDGAANIVAQSSPSLSNSPETDGGHEHGNGGDDTRFTKAAWFPDSERPVPYCIKVEGSFPVELEQVKGSVESALSDWTAMIARIRLYSTSVIAKKYVFVEDCDRADLQFLFGTPVSEFQSSNFGFVSRDVTEPSTLWSRGRVWISSQGAKWSEGFRLKGALLHLLGEVLGFDHVPGTVLDTRFEQWLKEVHSVELERKLTVIESSRQLVDVNGAFSGQVKMTEEIKRRLGLSSAAESEMIEVDNSDMTLKVQSQKLRFVRLYMREMKHGDLHHVVFYDKTGFYSWMRKIPKLLRTENYTIVSVIQFIDLPGRPQIILELNGDQAVKLSPM